MEGILDDIQDRARLFFPEQISEKQYNDDLAAIITMVLPERQECRSQNGTQMSPAEESVASIPPAE